MTAKLVGCSVKYIPINQKQGRLIERAHVLKLHSNNRIDLRWRRIARPDVDVDNVPFSEEPKPGHWSL